MIFWDALPTSAAPAMTAPFHLLAWKKHPRHSTMEDMTSPISFPFSKNKKKQMTLQTRVVPTLWLCYWFAFEVHTFSYHPGNPLSLLPGFGAKVTFPSVPQLFLRNFSWGTQHPREEPNILALQVLSPSTVRLSFSPTKITQQHGDEIENSFYKNNKIRSVFET